MKKITYNKTRIKILNEHKYHKKKHMFSDYRDEKPYISLGSAKVFAITSLDKYIEQKKLTKPSPLLPPETPADNPEASIAALQKEQSMLCEELNAERRRGEGLKSTFARAQTLAKSQLQTKLNSIAELLMKVDNPQDNVKIALNYIRDTINAENSHQPGELRSVSVPTEDEAKSSQTNQLKRENDKINKELKKMQAEKENLLKQLEQLNSQIETASASKKEYVEKLKTLYETFKKRDAAWKEKIKKMKGNADDIDESTN